MSDRDVSAEGGARELGGLAFVRPRDIERRSFEIIGEELGDRVLDPGEAPVIKRVIHTTADLDYADSLSFSPHATSRGAEALRRGCDVVTDTTMAMAGINKRVLARFGGRVLNFIGDEDVAARARELGLTRSAVAMDKAAALGRPLVLCVGNAPTALVRICELLDSGELVRPALVVGVPVGFVNVVESKELLLAHDVDRIVARGRKGGSNVAAAIVNALLYVASGDERE
ncbi:MAG: precorrin-8X methylmutase [Olsenella sp.]|nr:precorrin-8X methylmutase [Olsenella sp.]